MSSVESISLEVVAERAAVALEAYWDVVAAKRRLAMLETSLAQQDRLLDATQQLIDGEQIARLDIERNRAQRAATESSVAAGRRALTEARAALAREIGAFASELDVIDPDSDFARFLDEAVEATLDAEGLVRLALAERDDARASARVARSSRTSSRIERLSSVESISLEVVAERAWRRRPRAWLLPIGRRKRSAMP